MVPIFFKPYWPGYDCKSVPVVPAVVWRLPAIGWGIMMLWHPFLHVFLVFPGLFYPFPLLFCSFLTGRNSRPGRGKDKQAAGGVSPQEDGVYRSLQRIKGKL